MPINGKYLWESFVLRALNLFNFIQNIYYIFNHLFLDLLLRYLQR